MSKVLTYFTLMVLFCTAAFAQDLSTRKPKPQRKKAAPTTTQAPVNHSPKASKNKIEALIFNLGVHTEFYNNVQIDDSGSLRKFDPAPTIGAGLVLPQNAGTSNIMKNLVMFRGDIGYDPLYWLRLRLGTSLMWLNQHPKGGSTKVNNGNSTSTFYYPDENRSSLNNTLDLGLEAMYDAWSFRLQTYTYSVFKAEQRQVSYSLFISYYWGQ